MKKVILILAMGLLWCNIWNFYYLYSAYQLAKWCLRSSFQQ